MKSIFFVSTLLATSPVFADGREIWLGTCQACHAETLSGAPLITDKAAWLPRLAKGREALYGSALNGFAGAKGTEMPARGGNPSLTDEQVKAAVDYMVFKQGEGQ